MHIFYFKVETYKKQITELRNKVDSETKKSDRLEFDNKKLLEKVEALSVERDRLQTEREELKANNAEMADQMDFERVARNTGNIEEGDPESGKMR